MQQLAPIKNPVLVGVIHDLANATMRITMENRHSVDVRDFLNRSGTISAWIFAVTFLVSLNFDRPPSTCLIAAVISGIGCAVVRVVLWRYNICSPDSGCFLGVVVFIFLFYVIKPYLGLNDEQVAQCQCVLIGTYYLILASARNVILRLLPIEERTEGQRIQRPEGPNTPN
jgi:hypothetical protein